MKSIPEYLNHYIKLWEESSNDSPEFERSYSNAEQLNKEAQVNFFQGKLKSLQNRKKASQLVNDPAQSIFPQVKTFLQTVFDFKEEELALILSDAFTSSTKGFYYKARGFGSELKPESIYQAMRNVWIMNQVQLMLGKPVQVTPSVFAYSMIYPYSDNYLDDVRITPLEKQLFSKRLKHRLHGGYVKAQSFNEEQLYTLVGMFEEEFERKKFPEVYESLYAIHQGQTRSLQLINADNLSTDDVLNICFEKGGASVLADGYLVAGHLNPEQEKALFGYGIYLQLLDDLQDLDEDRGENTHTLFSYASESELTHLFNKTIHFGRKALEDMQCFTGIKNERMIALMQRSIETMAVETVGLNYKWYTASFVENLEKYSPLHFEYIREKRKQGKSQRFDLLQRYFDMSSKTKTEYVA